MKKIVLNHDNKKIFAVKWDKVADVKTIVVIVHGMAEHIERYDYLATILNNKNMIVYGYEAIGHGNAITKEEEKGHWEKGDFMQNVDNIDALITYAKGEHPNVKVFLLGHSMGSFLSKQYIIKYGSHIAGVILSGSSCTTPLMKVGAIIANMVSSKKDKLPNKTLDKLSFGGYNKAFKPNKTAFDWLSTDENEVNKYVDDPLCGFICTTGFFKEFTSSLKNLDKKSNLDLIPKNLPIYLFCGSDDPVSNMSKGVETLYKRYQKAGLTNVDLKIYDGMRHETLNEINKDIVIKDLISWILKHL